MPDITLPANLATLVLESWLYGILSLLFISTIFFLATRRTPAGHNQSTKHHFTSLVFLGVASLFIVVTAHWIVVIYQAFFAFIHLATATAEDAFYADLSQRSNIIKIILFFSSILIGDSLIIYRLWIIWGLNRYVVIFPIFTLIGTFVTSIFVVHGFTQWEPGSGGALFYKESKPRTETGFILSLLYDFSSFHRVPYIEEQCQNSISIPPNGTPLLARQWLQLMNHPVIPIYPGRKCRSPDVCIDRPAYKFCPNPTIQQALARLNCHYSAHQP
ncbi:hypothetical protein DFH09DRAFT_1283093 [Mycena vulgaris]|nr:hypothetical protein DFH09DRAFT_1283093 [Mycena vulgaris]